MDMLTVWWIGALVVGILIASLWTLIMVTDGFTEWEWDRLDWDEFFEISPLLFFVSLAGGLLWFLVLGLAILSLPVVGIVFGVLAMGRNIKKGSWKQ